MCAEVKPFKPLVFERDRNECLSPPFDTISKEEEASLKTHPYNITHLTLPDGTVDDVVNSKFKVWLKDEVLKRTREDSILVIRQSFTFRGVDYRRAGIIGLVKISPNDGAIKAHEKTFESAVMGRVNVMSKLQSQLEPIFLTADSNKLPDLLRDALIDLEPEISHKDADGTVTEVFRVTDTENVGRIEAALSGNALLVADGHHRLEATRRLSQTAPDDQKEFWSYVMAYITPLNDDGLIIAGIHRVLRKDVDFNTMKKAAEKYFELKEVDSPSSTDNMVIYTGSYYEVVLKENAVREGMKLAEDEPIVVAEALNQLLFREVMNLSDKDLEFSISYLHDGDKAREEVDSGNAGLAVFMPRWNKNDFFSVIAGGKFLPQKSTYFYPKVPSGIAIHSNFGDGQGQ